MRSREPDFWLVTIGVLLLAGGLVTLFSASSVKAAFAFGSSGFYLTHQLLYGLLPGAALFIVGYRMNPKTLKRLALPIFIIALAALILVTLPKFGVTVKGATRWLKIGTLSFQPAEFFKLAFILYLANFFASRHGKLGKFYETTFPFFVMLGVVGVLLLSQPATGTFGIIVITALTIYFAAGARLRDFLVAALLIAAALGTLILVSPYRFERIMVFLDPAADPRGAGYQINQSLIAIGSGGLWGVGLGHSRQKYNFLPETIGDSIFAIFAEETGFVGSLFLMLLFLAFLYRSVRVALRSDEHFARLLAMGISAWIVSQAFVNVAALTGALPLTGIPLPFFSYGGSALAAELAGMGILLGVSRGIK